MDGFKLLFCFKHHFNVELLNTRDETADIKKYKQFLYQEKMNNFPLDLNFYENIVIQYSHYAK